MLNKPDQIERIKRQLFPVEADETLLSDLFDDWYNVALSKSNRSDGDDSPALLALVRQTVVASYNRRGNEGTTSSSAGGQSESYEDLDEKLYQSILKSGLRVFRP